jgi:hypothetical protein
METEKLLLLYGIPPVRSSLPAWIAYRYQELWMVPLAAASRKKAFRSRSATEVTIGGWIM